MGAMPNWLPTSPTKNLPMTRRLSRLLARATRQPLRMVSHWTARVAALHGISASLYYLLVSREFRREQQAVLAGKLAYQRSLGSSGASSPLLRRNIHRLEKGLIMRPQRIPFALDYIGETVQHYVAAVQAGRVDVAELQWAENILSEYFACSVNEPKLEPWHRLYTSARPTNSDLVPGNDPSLRFAPYPHRLLPDCPVPYDDLLTLLKRRRSVRWFKQQAVPGDLVAKAVQAASLAPSACNRQPFWFELFNDPRDAQEVTQLALGSAGFSQNVPCLLVVIGDLQAFPYERDRHLIYIDASLAAMQLMLALETLGLSSCPLNWADISAQEQLMQNRLGLKLHQRPVMLIALGYADPDGWIPFSQKKPVPMLLRSGSLNHRPVQAAVLATTT